MSEPVQYCTFHVAGQYLGIDVRLVQEIIRSQVLTRVPLAPAVVRGLINLRGQIVTAIDLRRRLDVPERPAGQEPVNVVVRSDDGAVSLLVDEIGDVVTVNGEGFEPPPATLRGPGRELIRGAHKLADRLLLALDLDRVLGTK